MGEIDASDYLVWKNAYLPSADIRARKIPAEVGEKVQDKKVDRDEWESFLYSRRLSLEMMERDHLIKQQLIGGENVGGGLKAAGEFFKDYSDFSPYINDYLKKHPDIAPGGSVSSDPNDLLKLAKKYDKSEEIISWIGLTCHFQNVSDEFRKVAVDHLVKTLLKNPKNSVVAAHALYEVVQNDKFTSLYGKDIIKEIWPKLPDFLKQRRWQNSASSLFFFFLLDKCGFSNKQKIGFLKDLSDLKMMNLISASVLTQSDSASSDDILDMCRAISKDVVKTMQKKGKDVAYQLLYSKMSLLYCLAYAYVNPRVTDADAQLIIEQFKDILSSAVKNGMGVYEGVKQVTMSLVIMMTAKFRPLSDPKVASRTMTEFARILFPPSDPEKDWNYSYLWDVPRDLLLNLSEAVPPSELGSLFSGFSDVLLSRNSDYTDSIMRSLAVTLNLIHDRDLERNDNLRANLKWEKQNGRITQDQYDARLRQLDEVRDIKRKTIVSSLSYRTKINLIALGGSDLYTSSFEALYSSLGISSKSIDQFIGELKNAEASFPDKDIITNCIFTLGTFGKLPELIALKPEYFMNILGGCLAEKDEDKLIKNIFFLNDVIKDILTGGKFRGEKMKMENILIEQYKTLLKNSGRSRKTGAMAFIISRNCSNFSKTNQAEVQGICSGLPDVASQIVPAKWLSKDGIRTILFFYQQEHFDLIRSMFKGFGYQSIKVDEQTYELSKIINGIKLSIRITINQDNKFKKKVIASPEYSIIGHRGHSFEVGNTLISGDYQDQGKLFILGSCGGFRDIPDLMDSYSGNYFVATETMGVGETNNVFLNNFLGILAQNKDKIKSSSYTFFEMHKQILSQMPNIEQTGIKMPEVTILYDFLAKYK